MFDSPFGFFALVVAIVAFIFARKAINHAATLRARLDAMEAAWEATLVRPPPTPLQELEQTRAPSSPGIAAEQPPTIAETYPVAPVADDKTTAASAASCRKPNPVSRNASAPAGWSGSAA